MKKINKNGWTNEALRYASKEKKKELARIALTVLFFRILFFSICVYIGYSVGTAIKKNGLKHYINQMWEGQSEIKTEIKNEN